MLDLFQMWALVEVIGIVSLPLTVTIFRNVPDRGWAWSKALGIIVLSFCTWFPLMITRTIPYNRPVLTGIALLLLAIMLFGILRTHRTIRQIIRTHGYYILVTELVFFGLVLLLGWIRSFDPNIESFERYMDEGFLASIMRGPNLPPHDMWFAGYPINYYYYGHYAVATLAMLLGQPASIAFNTGISMLFGLTGVSLFGVSSNIVAWAKQLRKQLPSSAPLQSDTEQLEASQHSDTEQLKAQFKPESASRGSLFAAIPFGLFTIILCLFMGNMASGIRWLAERNKSSFYDWFGPSRVIPNTINEFPAFSYLLSDFHAHVLTLAFTILAIGVALNLFLEPSEKGLFIYGRGWRLPLNLICSALILGSIGIMNSWDYPTYAGLALICICGQQWLANEKRFNWTLILDVFSAAVSLIALSFLFFLPFYIGFISPAEGIGLVTISNRSSLMDELLIYALFAFLFITFVSCSAFARPLLARTRVEKNTETVEDDTETEIDDEENPRPALHKNKFKEKSLVSWSLVSALCGVGFVVIGLIFQTVSPQNATLFIALGITITACVILLRHVDERTHSFALLLGAIAFALVTVCEIIYLRDLFVNQPRFNTVFKFYFQAWALLSIASGAGLFFIIERFKQISLLPSITDRLALNSKIVWTTCLLLLLGVGSIYPIVAPYYRSLRVNPATGTGAPGIYRSNSLDGLDYLKHDPHLPGDYQAIEWLNSHITGDPGIIETTGDGPNNDYSSCGFPGYQGNSYTYCDDISAFTGLSTPMGWEGHEVQWRINWYNLSPANEISSEQRINDINTIYTSNDPKQVLALMARYNIQYLYVGSIEHATYPNSNLERFKSFMQIVYRDPTNGVTIYKIK